MRTWAKVAAVVGAGLAVVYLVRRARAAPPPPKTETSMVVTTEPPSSAVAGEPFDFAGYLEDAGGNRLPGRTVNLMIDGGLAQTTATDANGEWVFSITSGATGETITIYAEFPGDEEYAGCRGGF